MVHAAGSIAEVARKNLDCIEAEHIQAEGYIADVDHSPEEEDHHTDAGCIAAVEEGKKILVDLDSIDPVVEGGHADIAGMAHRWSHSSLVQILDCYLRRRLTGCSLADTLLMNSYRRMQRIVRSEAAVVVRMDFLTDSLRCLADISSWFRMVR